MVTLYFSRKFTRGTLRGVVHHDHLTFPTTDAAATWLHAVDAKAKHLGYRIVDSSFFDYQDPDAKHEWFTPRW